MDQTTLVPQPIPLPPLAEVAPPTALRDRPAAIPAAKAATRRRLLDLAEARAWVGTAEMEAVA